MMSCELIKASTMCSYIIQLPHIMMVDKIP